MNSLIGSLHHFIEAYRGNPKLMAEQRGFSKAIALIASDSGEAVTVHLCDGRVAGVDAGRADGDVVITSELVTLCDILELRRSPNEPYLFGELTVEGPEADFLRLDYIVSVLCPL